MDLPLLKAIINNSCGTPLTIRIQNPSSTDKGPKSLNLKEALFSLRFTG